MADPLSIAASIVGLLAAASKVYSVVFAFMSATSDAPNSAASVLEIVLDTKLTLAAVQQLIEMLDRLPKSRKSLVQLDHLSVIVTHSVLTISELEAVVCHKDGQMYRLRWMWNERKILNLLPRLESQKISLALLANVLQCESDSEALESHNTLSAKVDEVMQQNKALARRLEEMDSRFLSHPDARSVKFGDDTASLATAPRLSTMSARGGPRRGYFGFPMLSTNEFEVALERSRVYKRTKSRRSDVSFTTSTAPTNAWSMLSGLSLSDVSVVSVFRLPLTLDDIDLFASGTTFSTILAQHAKKLEEQSDPGAAGGTRIPTHTLTQRDLDLAMVLSNNRNSGPVPLLYNALESYSGRIGLKSNTSVPTFKLVVVGNSDALKKEMLHAYACPEGTASRGYTSCTFDNFRVQVRIGPKVVNLAIYDITGQESYPALRSRCYMGADIFLVLARTNVGDNLQPVKERWVPEISHICPGKPYLIVGTHGAIPQEDRENLMGASNWIGNEAAEITGAVQYLDCHVEDPRNVRTVFSQAILVALGLHRKPKGLKESLRFRALTPLIEEGTAF